MFSSSDVVEPESSESPDLVRLPGDVLIIALLWGWNALTTHNKIERVPSE